MAFFKKYSLLVLLIWILPASDIRAQTIELSLRLTCGRQDLNLENETYKLNQTDSFKLSVLKFYISNLEFWNNDTLLLKEENSYHLIDASKPESLHLQVSSTKNFGYDELRFNLGVDSTTTVSGAMSGALDPINGMYWTWQSGYIHSKIEGMVFLNGTGKEFVYHLGGYQYPFNSLQEVRLKTSSSKSLGIQVDLFPFLSKLNFNKQTHLMSPCDDSVLYSKWVSDCFSINQK